MRAMNSASRLRAAVTATLLDRARPGALEQRREAAGKLYSVEEFAAEVAKMATADVETGHVELVGGADELKEEDLASRVLSVPESALKVAFSLQRVSRVDPGETLLAHCLLGTEDDLEDTREPMAFPVFGRGRALLALVGAISMAAGWPHPHP